MPPSDMPITACASGASARIAVGHVLGVGLEADDALAAAVGVAVAGEVEGDERPPERHRHRVPGVRVLRAAVEEHELGRAVAPHQRAQAPVRTPPPPTRGGRWAGRRRADRTPRRSRGTSRTRRRGPVPSAVRLLTVGPPTLASAPTTPPGTTTSDRGGRCVRRTRVQVRHLRDARRGHDRPDHAEPRRREERAEPGHARRARRRLPPRRGRRHRARRDPRWQRHDVLVGPRHRERGQPRGDVRAHASTRAARSTAAPAAGPRT